jgi:hypothetical protein
MGQSLLAAPVQSNAPRPAHADTQGFVGTPEPLLTLIRQERKICNKGSEHRFLPMQSAHNPGLLQIPRRDG